MQGGGNSHGCGQVTAGVQQKVRDTLLVLIAAVPEGHLGQEEPMVGSWIGNPQPGIPIFVAGQPSPPQHPSSSLYAPDWGFVSSLFTDSTLLFPMHLHRHSLL